MRHTNVLSNKKQRFFFFNIGLIIGLFLVIIAFKIDFDKEVIIIDDEIIFPPIGVLEQTTSHKETKEVPKVKEPEMNNQNAIERLDPFEEKESQDKKEDNQGSTNIDIDTIHTYFMPPEPVDTSTYTTVEIMPEFPGGDAALMKYLSNNINYPYREAQVGISGKVFVQFVVAKDGRISKVKTVRSPSRGLKLEAERVVKAMPRWEPGIQNGKYVKVRYTLPVTFLLRN